MAGCVFLPTAERVAVNTGWTSCKSHPPLHKIASPVLLITNVIPCLFHQSSSFCSSTFYPNRNCATGSGSMGRSGIRTWIWSQSGRLTTALHWLCYFREFLESPLLCKGEGLAFIFPLKCYFSSLCGLIESSLGLQFWQPQHTSSDRSGKWLNG